MQPEATSILTSVFGSTLKPDTSISAEQMVTEATQMKL